MTPVFDVEVFAQMKVFERGVSGEGWQHREQVCIKTCQHKHTQLNMAASISRPLKPPGRRTKKSQGHRGTCLWVPPYHCLRYPEWRWRRLAGTALGLQPRLQTLAV